jgi:predicted DNA-binding protein (MmcQ/YjbR family)
MDSVIFNLSKFLTMNVEEIREYCISKKAVSESFPFDETTLVFKVVKMFCLLGLDDSRVSLKNDPEKNIELRAHYPSIYEGYHLNKQHWNTINLDGTVPAVLMKQMIDESYDLIVKSLTKKQKEEIEKL